MLPTAAGGNRRLPVGKRVTAEPQSVLILGHRADCLASRNGIVHIRDGEEEEKRKKGGTAAEKRVAGGKGRSMKWVYGKQDWKTFERGLENCYLITNGLGGYSSPDHDRRLPPGEIMHFFMACTEAPNHRYNMIQRLEEQITVNGKIIHFFHTGICGRQQAGGIPLPVRIFF